MNFVGCAQYTLLAMYEAALAILFSAFYKMNHRVRKKVTYLFLSLGLLAFLTMFHSSNVGNDTLNYIAMFQRVSNSNLLYYVKNSLTEPGYLTFVWLLTKISDDPQILFIISGLFVYLSIGRFLFKYVEAPGFVCFAMVAMMKFDFFISAQRQAISIAILLWAYDFLYEKKTFRFMVVSVVAVLFHYSSVIFIITYIVFYSKLLQNAKLTRKFYVTWAFSLLIIMAFFQRIFNVVLRLFPKYSYYEGTALFDGEPRLALFLQALVSITLFVVSMVLMTQSDKSQHGNKLFTYLSIVNISVVMVATNATALNRLCSTYTLYPASQYSVALSSEKATYKGNHMILVALTIIAFYLYGLIIVMYRTPAWYTTYPYSFLWSH